MYGISRDTYGKSISTDIPNSFANQSATRKSCVFSCDLLNLVWLPESGGAAANEHKTHNFLLSGNLRSYWSGFHIKGCHPQIAMDHTAVRKSFFLKTKRILPRIFFVQANKLQSWGTSLLQIGKEFFSRYFLSCTNITCRIFSSSRKLKALNVEICYFINRKQKFGFKTDSVMALWRLRQTW